MLFGGRRCLFVISTAAFSPCHIVALPPPGGGHTVAVALACSHSPFVPVAEYGAYSIRYSTPHTSGGCSNADGSAFIPGEEIWLEGLDGLPNLRGVTVEALGKEGNILFSISVPDTEEYRYVNTAASGGWIVSRGD